MATEGVPKPSEESHGVRQVAIVSKLAVPRWPCRERIAWGFAMSSRMLHAGTPSPPLITATRLGALCSSIRDTAEAFCHVFLPDRDGSILSPRCLHSMEFMAGTLRVKFPVLLNLILGIRLDVDWTRVAPSQVHRQGVFAKKFIPKNTVVTTYPAVLVEFLEDGATLARQRGVGNSTRVMKTLMSHRAATEPSGKQMEVLRRLRNTWCDYGLDLPGGVTIYADPDTFSASACGHKINDHMGAADAPNVIECPLCGGVVIGILSLRDIDEGEELFMSYGPGYWRDRQPQQKSGPWTCGPPRCMYKGPT